MPWSGRRHGSRETGKYDPSLPLAFALAKLFGKPIEKIFQPE